MKGSGLLGCQQTPKHPGTQQPQTDVGLLIHPGCSYLPPLSDWQRVSAPAVTPCSNLLLFITADRHSQPLARPPAPQLLLAKSFLFPAKQGWKGQCPAAHFPRGGRPLTAWRLASFIVESQGAVPSFLAWGSWGGKELPGVAVFASEPVNLCNAACSDSSMEACEV